MNAFTEGLVSIALAVVGLATVAVLMSRQANTAGVITASGNAFSGVLQSATNPYSGSNGTFGGLNMPSLPGSIFGN